MSKRRHLGERAEAPPREPDMEHPDSDVNDLRNELSEEEERTGNRLISGLRRNGDDAATFIRELEAEGSESGDDDVKTLLAETQRKIAKQHRIRHEAERRPASLPNAPARQRAGKSETEGRIAAAKRNVRETIAREEEQLRIGNEQKALEAESRWGKMAEEERYRRAQKRLTPPELKPLDVEPLSAEEDLRMFEYEVKEMRRAERGEIPFPSEEPPDYDKLYEETVTERKQLAASATERVNELRARFAEIRPPYDERELWPILHELRDLELRLDDAFGETMEESDAKEAGTLHIDEKETGIAELARARTRVGHALEKMTEAIHGEGSEGHPREEKIRKLAFSRNSKELERLMAIRTMLGAKPSEYATNSDLRAQTIEDLRTRAARHEAEINSLSSLSEHERDLPDKRALAEMAKYLLIETSLLISTLERTAIADEELVEDVIELAPEDAIEITDEDEDNTEVTIAKRLKQPSVAPPPPSHRLHRKKNFVPPPDDDLDPLEGQYHGLPPGLLSNVHEMPPRRRISLPLGKKKVLEIEETRAREERKRTKRKEEEEDNAASAAYVNNEREVDAEYRTAQGGSAAGLAEKQAAQRARHTSIPAISGEAADAAAAASHEREKERRRRENEPVMQAYQARKAAAAEQRRQTAPKPAATEAEPAHVSHETDGLRFGYEQLDVRARRTAELILSVREGLKRPLTYEDREQFDDVLIELSHQYATLTAARDELDFESSELQKEILLTPDQNEQTKLKIQRDGFASRVFIIDDIRNRIAVARRQIQDALRTIPEPKTKTERSLYHDDLSQAKKDRLEALIEGISIRLIKNGVKDPEAFLRWGSGTILHGINHITGARLPQAQISEPELESIRRQLAEIEVHYLSKRYPAVGDTDRLAEARKASPLLLLEPDADIFDIWKAARHELDRAHGDGAQPEPAVPAKKETPATAPQEKSLSSAEDLVEISGNKKAPCKPKKKSNVLKRAKNALERTSDKPQMLSPKAGKKN